MRHFPSLIVLGIAALTLAACGAEEPSVTPTPTPAPETSPTGQALFVSKGCGSCHGADALGSEIAPALPGHSASQVRRQVRNPIGSMPPFGDAQISDAELDAIVEFITGLEGGAGHVEPTGLPQEEALSMHLSMALLAVKAGNVAEARHHLGHALDQTADEGLRERLQHVDGELDAGDLHGAEHVIEEVVGHGTAGEDLVELHLRLALSAIDEADAGEAEHHLSHAEALMEDPERLEELGEAFGHLLTNSLEEAEHTIHGLLEGEEHHHE